jgi:hypothetical protein
MKVRVTQASSACSPCTTEIANTGEEVGKQKQVLPHPKYTEQRQTPDNVDQSRPRLNAQALKSDSRDSEDAHRYQVTHTAHNSKKTNNREDKEQQSNHGHLQHEREAEHLCTDSGEHGINHCEMKSPEKEESEQGDEFVLTVWE